MITILKNDTNKVALTLSEKSLLTGTTYNLFVVVNDLDGTEKIFTATNLSTYIQRSSIFDIIESNAAEDLLDGKIHLTGNTAQYTYTVYESAVPFSSNTLSISATTSTILETGRLFVDGDEITNNTNEIYY